MEWKRDRGMGKEKRQRGMLVTGGNRERTERTQCYREVCTVQSYAQLICAPYRWMECSKGISDSSKKKKKKTGEAEKSCQSQTRTRKRNG